MKYKVYCLMNYENNSFGIDIVIAILDKGDPYLDGVKSLEHQLNGVFIQSMETKEDEIQYFLSSYYNISFAPHYSNLDKICKVREVEFSDSDDDIIVKKYEDEDI